MRAAVLACVVLTVSSCTGSRAGDSVQLQVFGDPAEVAGYRAMIAEFQQRNPATRVSLTPIPSQGDHMAKLATGFAGGDPPDLFIVNYRRFGQFAGKGVLQPLDEIFERGALRRSGFYEQSLEAFTFQGKVLCLPQNISSPVVYYNRGIFDRFGVDPPDPSWTWDGFVTTARAVTRDTDGDGRTDVHGLGVEPNLTRLAPFVWQAGGQILDDEAMPKALALTDVEALEASRFFKALLHTHHVVPTLPDVKSEDLEARFANGRLSMYIDTRRATPVFRAVRGLDFDVAPLPRGKQAASILHSDAYCMARASGNREEAFRFLEFALGTDGATIVSRSGRTVPSLRSVAESAAFLDPSLKPAASRVWLDAIPLIRRLPNIATWNEVETRADKVVEEWFYSTEAPEVLGLEIDVETFDLFTVPPSPRA